MENEGGCLLKVNTLIFILLLVTNTSYSQNKFQQEKFTTIDTEAFGDNSRHWYGIFDKGNVINPTPGLPRYKATEIEKVADNILLYQKDNGGWPKNYDIMAILTPEQKDSLVKAKPILNTTFDNGTTYTHVACLANIYTATRNEKYKAAAIKGLAYILSAQYKNGGWPQYYPLESNYSRYITFNDGAFIGIMTLLKDITDGKPEYSFINDQQRKKIKAAYDKGLDCILKTQINDNGKPTAWCQQHDEIRLKPAWARKFEPPSICNQESSGVVLFLMDIDHPTKAIVNAIQSAVAWFEESKIYNTRVKVISAPSLNTPFRISKTDRVVINDPAVPPIWTRFYELKTHRPLFCNRDSKVVYSLAEVDRERRDGYAWYTYSPQKVLDRYPTWKKKWAGG